MDEAPIRDLPTVVGQEIAQTAIEAARPIDAAPQHRFAMSGLRIADDRSDPCRETVDEGGGDVTAQHLADAGEMTLGCEHLKAMCTVVAGVEFLREVVRAHAAGEDVRIDGCDRRSGTVDVHPLVDPLRASKKRREVVQRTL